MSAGSACPSSAPLSARKRPSATVSSASGCSTTRPCRPRTMSDILRIIPLGGLGEVGKNMTLYELDGERIVVDAGLSFPRDEHLGVDLVLPAFSYLEDRPLLAIV